jgi:hypothetical protein
MLLLVAHDDTRRMSVCCKTPGKELWLDWSGGVKALRRLDWHTSRLHLFVH